MYYDLIASFPHLPHFERGDRLPITPLRLTQRLRLLRPAHAEQLIRTRALVGWRPQRMTAQSDAGLVSAYRELVESPLESPLRDYVAFRLTQQTLLAALRRKRDGAQLPEPSNAWGIGPHIQHIRMHWEAPGFRLQHLYPWLTEAQERLSAGDAFGLERLMMDFHWQWLSRLAEANMFGFEAVVAFVFKWDMLEAWLTYDAGRARIRFRESIDEVTQHEQV